MKTSQDILLRYLNFGFTNKGLFSCDWDTSILNQVSNCDGVMPKICAWDLFGSQIPVTIGGLELRISCIWISYLTH